MHSSPPTACGSACNSNWLATASCTFLATARAAPATADGKQQHHALLPSNSTCSACNSRWLPTSSCTSPQQQHNALLQQQHVQRLQQQMVSNSIMHFSSAMACARAAPQHLQIHSCLVRASRITPATARQRLQQQLAGNSIMHYTPATACAAPATSDVITASGSPLVTANATPATADS